MIHTIRDLNHRLMGATGRDGTYVVGFKHRAAAKRVLKQLRTDPHIRLVLRDQSRNEEVVVDLEESYMCLGYVQPQKFKSLPFVHNIGTILVDDTCDDIEQGLEGAFSRPDGYVYEFFRVLQKCP